MIQWVFCAGFLVMCLGARPAQAAGSGWAIVDGDAGAGLNADSAQNAQKVCAAVYNNELYTAWEENKLIRVKKFNGTTWTFVDGGGRRRLTNGTCFGPVLTVFGGYLYLSWEESNSLDGVLYYNRIYVDRYTGSSWENVGGSLTKATNTLTGTPSLCVFNSQLYAAWSERENTNYKQQIRVARLEAGPSWAFVDGNGDTGLNYDTLQDAYDPILQVFGTALYTVWLEGGSPRQIRAKKYNGVWTQADSGSLNDSTSRDPRAVSMAVYGNDLYMTWTEHDTSLGRSLAVMKQLNGGSWTKVDGGSSPGVNYNNLNSIYDSFILPVTTETVGTGTGGTDLVLAFYETSNPSQCRVKLLHDGAWAFIDGNSARGINQNPTKAAYRPVLVGFNNKLYALWYEQDLATTQIRAAVYAPMTISPSIPLLESDLNFASINVELKLTTFKDATLDTANFMLLNPPPGLSIQRVDYVSPTECTVVLHYTGNINSNYTQFGLKIAGAEVLLGFDLVSVNELTVTAQNPPTVSTGPAVTRVSDTSYTVGGNVTGDGGATVTERGIEYKKSTDAEYLRAPAGTAGTGVFSVTLNGLEPVRYDVRAYAVNNQGTSTGGVVSFTPGIDSLSAPLLENVNAITSGATTTYNPYHDGYMWIGFYPPSDTEKAALKFDISGIQSDWIVSKVTLKVYVLSIDNSVSTPFLALRGTSVDGWSEAGPVYYPSNEGSPILQNGEAEVNVTSTGWVEFDVTGFVIGQIDDYVTFVFTGSGTAEVGFADRTYASYKPMLEIVYTTPQAPTLISAERNSNNEIVVTLSTESTGITKTDNGGFSVEETGNPGKTYSVSSITQGADAKHVVLAVADMAVSGKEGVTVKYTAGGSGTVKSIVGDLPMETDGVGVIVDAWDTSAPTGYGVTIDQTYINNINEAALSFTFTGAEVGATYNYTLTSSGGGGPLSGSGPISSATRQVTGVTTIGLNNGTLTLSVTLTDIAGNTGSPATDTALKDTLAPSEYSVAIDQPLINNANKTAMSFVISGAETGASYTYTITSSGGGTPATGSGTITSAAQTVAGIDVSGLNDGNLTLSFTLTDPAGNTGIAATKTVAKDASPPAGYTVSIDQPYINNNKTALSFTFANAEAGAAYSYTLTSNGGGDPVTGGGTITSAPQQVIGVTTYSLNEGTLTLSVTLADVHGNTGEPATDTVLKDTLMPAGYSAYFSVIINNANQTSASFTFMGAEIGASFSYSITSSGGGPAVISGATGCIANSSTQQVTGLDLSGLNDGILAISFKMTDAADNEGEFVTSTMTKDTAAPSGYGASINPAVVNVLNQTGFSFTFSGAETGATYNYSIASSGGGTLVTGSGPVAGATQMVAGIDVSSLNDGTLTLSVTLTDAAGNGGSGVTDTVNKDTAPPAGYTVAINQPYINNANKTALSFTFAGAEVGTTYNYTLSSSGGGEPVTGNGMISSATQQVAGVTTIGLNEGTLTLHVTLTDTAGNAGSAATDTVLKDTIAPSAVSFLPADNATGVSQTADLIIDFGEPITKGTGNVTIRKTSDDSIVAAIGVGGTNVVAAGTTVTIDPTADLAESTGYYVEVDATAFKDGHDNNYAGISGKTAWNFTTGDTTTPSGYNVDIDQPYINNSNKTAMSFTFAGAEIGTTYSYTLTSSGGGDPVTGSGTISSPTQQVIGVTTMGLNEGTLALSVTLTDGAGNTGAAVTDTVLKDTLMPAGYNVSINPAVVNGANQTDFSFTFSGAEVGAAFSYTISSSSGGAEVTWSGTAAASGGTAEGIDVSGLNDGTLTVSFTMTDPAGNPGLPIERTVLKDTAAPGVVISTAAGNPAQTAPIQVTITFNETVTGFTLEDLAVANGVAGNFSGGGTSYSVEITPAAAGAVTIDIAAGAAQDAAGNPNTSATPLSLTFAPEVQPVTGLSVNPYGTGAVRLTWDNPATGWEKTLVVRKSGGYPASPTDGAIVYQGTAEEAYDLDLPTGTFHYAVYSSYYGAYSAPATGSITISVAGNKIRQTYQPGDGGFSALRTAQSWRGTSYTAWNGAELAMGCGNSGARSGVWLRYADLIGSLAGQVPSGARIIGAKLVLHIKRYEPAARLNAPYTIKIYRVPEAAGFGAPIFSAIDGLRTGLDWSYRDHRLGMNKPWAAGASDIAAALGGAIDTIEFIPEVFTAEGGDEISLDVTWALKAWAGDGETLQANQGFFLVIEGGNPGDVVVFDGATAASPADRPLLEVVYSTAPLTDLTGPASSVINLSAMPGTGQIALSWTNPSDADVAGVRVVRRIGRTPFNSYDGDVIYDGTGASLTDTGLDDGTVYYYAAFTYDADRNCGSKVWIKAVPGTPAAPVLTATVGTNRVDLSWTVPTDATSYALYRVDGSEVRRIELGNVTSYIDYNVATKTYIYYVAGLNGNGEGQPSNEASVPLTVDPITPIWPYDLAAANITNTTVTLTWTEDVANETGFVIERSADGAEWSPVGSTGFDMTSYTDSGLTPNTLYYYRVKAVKGGGGSAYSNIISVTTDAAPFAPTNLTWTVISAGRVNLSWTDAAANETGYRIDVCDAAGNVLLSVEIGPDAVSYSVIGLTPGVGYIFKVSAINAAGAGTAETEIVRTGFDPKDGLI